MDLTPRLKNTMVQLNTLLRLTNDEKQKRVLEDIQDNLIKTFQSDTEFIVRLAGNIDKKELTETLQQIQKDTGQNHLDIHIIDDDEFFDEYQSFREIKESERKDVENMMW